MKINWKIVLKSILILIGGAVVTFFSNNIGVGLMLIILLTYFEIKFKF